MIPRDERQWVESDRSQDEDESCEHDYDEEYRTPRNGQRIPIEDD